MARSLHRRCDRYGNITAARIAELAGQIQEFFRKIAFMPAWRVYDGIREEIIYRGERSRCHIAEARNLHGSWFPGKDRQSRIG